ncbi:hypothetical protein HV819_11280 [Anaerococcus sp. AGMB00486]|uniref:YbbR-like protein n=2 Tax=Anaerococcus TaxID=165779 RepID=A0ABX2ND24_9FIRM|nr:MULTISPECIES: CdaR family protein [Anaerococcus]MDY3006900.1 CdaR family protein [Anaerococcus porci]MSS77771.1 hypothetical protein [Anaerococcus porci]NVF12538.1 hypothetical protein [Anaerococcus faecalis]
MNKKNDRKLMILSILVAIIMWAFVMTSTNPSLSKTIRSVPLTIKNQEQIQEQGYAIVGKDEVSSVNVRVEGARSDLIGLSSEDLIASVDLGSASEGIKTVNVKVNGPSGIRVESITPSNINFKIEKIVEKKLPVDIKIDDKIKDSKIIEVAEQSPTEVSVKGLRKNVDKVEKILLKVKDEKVLDGKIHDIGIIPVDKDGNLVEKVELSQNDVSISFDVLASKEVDVKLDTVGSLPNNMQIKEEDINPQKVVIKGEAAVVEKINSISTKKINLSEISDKNFEKSVELEIPNGISLNDNDGYVNVSFKVGK